VLPTPKGVGLFGCRKSLISEHSQKLKVSEASGLQNSMNFDSAQDFTILTCSELKISCIYNHILKYVVFNSDIK